MADGKSREAWGRTSAVLAMIANTVRDPKKRSRPFSAKEFNPYLAGGGRKRRVSVEQLSRELSGLAKLAKAGGKVPGRRHRRPRRPKAEGERRPETPGD